MWEMPVPGGKYLSQACSCAQHRAAQGGIRGKVSCGEDFKALELAGESAALEEFVALEDVS